MKAWLTHSTILLAAIMAGLFVVLFASLGSSSETARDCDTAVHVTAAQHAAHGLTHAAGESSHEAAHDGVHCEAGPMLSALPESAGWRMVARLLPQLHDVQDRAARDLSAPEGPQRPPQA